MEQKDGISSYNMFVSLHHMQLESSGVPQIFWLALFKKLENQIFDAGSAFAIYQIDYEGDVRKETDPLYTVLVCKEDGINCNDGTQIYLIDHAWTYEGNKAECNLTQIPGLLFRLCNLMGIDNDLPSEERIEKVCLEMWRYNQTYAHGADNVEDSMPLWYIMDEFGSAIQHSSKPNFRTVPFYYVHDGTTYTLLFPIKNMDVNGEVTRDFVEGPFSQNKEMRDALLIPWKPTSFKNVDYVQKEPDKDYFLSGHVPEVMPEDQSPVKVDKNKILKVYSDYSFLNEYLKHPGFEIVSDSSEADILWLTSHFKNYKEFRETQPEKFINQFPYENVMTIKDLLAIICQRKKDSKLHSYKDNPAWFPTTYNLKTELVQFMSYYQHRQDLGLCNYWICKPWNLARGLDTYITNNLNCIARLPFSGPKIAQKYIENPVVFHRPEIGLVKFDIRYVLLLKSVIPLKAYVYRNFFLRFSNKCFEMRDFNDYERHFTVMNYNENAPLHRMLCQDFVPEFNRQYPGEDWSKIEDKIFKALKELLEAAVMKKPPFGIGHNVQSRALYAVDLMLSWDATDCGNEQIQPKLLEVNWIPDCKRACEYYPDFYDDIFLLLFKDIENPRKFQSL